MEIPSTRLEVHTAILLRTKAVKSSSTHNDWVASRVIDGNTRRDADDCQCCSATTHSLDPWYELDLDKSHSIHQLDVIGRTEWLSLDQSFQDMQTTFTQVSLDGFTDSPETTITERVGNVTYVLPVPKYTRYISFILRNVTQHFTMCELIVYGDCADGEFGGDPCDNVTGICSSGKCLPGYSEETCGTGEINAAILSRNKAVRASSTFKDWVPSRMVDGNLETYADSCYCCSATNHQLEPWYELDVGKSHRIHQINVMGRMNWDYFNHVVPLWRHNITSYRPTLVYHYLPLPESLQDMQITFTQVSLDGFTDSPETAITGRVGSVTYVLPVPKYTRYISLVLRNVTQHFTMCELIVYGDCADGEFGDYCENRCHCEGDPCDQVTGICSSGNCLPGYSGETCDTECQGGTYGPGCTQKCGLCLNNVECDTTFGICSGRCSAGYQGNTCKQERNTNYYGQDCLSQCGPCINRETCNHMTGICTNGCTDGYQYRNGYCDLQCDDGTYGKGCVSQCGRCYNDSVCNKMSGKCSICAAGFKGDRCDVEESLSVVASCSVPVGVAIGGTAGTILLIEAFIGAFVYLIWKRRQADRSSPEEVSPYEMPDRAAFTSEHPYEQRSVTTTPTYENTLRSQTNE